MPRVLMVCVRALKAGCSPIILSYYLAYLFNLSLTTGYVPKCRKKKRVTPLFKKGNTDDLNNYRPIFILPVTKKFFEKVVHRQVVDFLDSRFVQYSKLFPIWLQECTFTDSCHLCF